MKIVYIKYKIWQLLQWLRSGFIFGDLGRASKSPNFWVSVFIGLFVASSLSYILRPDMLNMDFALAFATIGLFLSLIHKDYKSGNHIKWMRKNVKAENDNSRQS